MMYWLAWYERRITILQLLSSPLRPLLATAPMDIGMTPLSLSWE